MKRIVFSPRRSHLNLSLYSRHCQQNAKHLCSLRQCPTKSKLSQMRRPNLANPNHSSTVRRTCEHSNGMKFHNLIPFTRVETVNTLKQYYLLVPSHVREVYLYYLLCNPPSSITHLRRAPPEKAKSMRASKNGTSKKKPPRPGTSRDDEEVVQPPPTIIFCTRPKAAAYLTEFLKTLSIRATALHSRLTQRERLTSLDLFRAYVVPVLVSTDVGARGLDIEDVAMVINWDMPSGPEEYTHRVGRTARRGRSGISVSFVTERDEERVLRVEERVGTSVSGQPIWFAKPI